MTPKFQVETESAALAAEWSALAERCGAPPFRRPEWFAAWWPAFGHGEMAVATLRRRGELAAALPLARGRGVLHAPVNWHTPSYGPVAAGDEARRELLRGLYALPVRAVDLSLLDGETGDAEAATRAAADAGRHTVRRTLLRSPYLSLDGDWAAYEQSLGRSRRREVHRQWRRLGELGKVRVDVVTGGDGLDAALQEAYAIEASGWKSVRGTAIASTVPTRRFYTELARRASEQGWLRLAFLRLDGRAVACDLALEHDGCWYALKGGYDRSLRTRAPGLLLLHAELERAFEHGLRRFELLGEPEPYKLDWTNRFAERLWLQALWPSAYGRTALALLRARERARPYARRVRRRLAA